jgi:hypothetical protein
MSLNLSWNLNVLLEVGMADNTLRISLRLAYQSNAEIWRKRERAAMLLRYSNRAKCPLDLDEYLDHYWRSVVKVNHRNNDSIPGCIPPSTSQDACPALQMWSCENPTKCRNSLCKVK